MSRNDPKFQFLGNHPLLDFVNTKTQMKGGSADALPDFESYVDWLTEASLIPSAKHNEIALHWRDPKEKEQILEKVRVFRANLRRMVLDLADGKPVSTTVTDEINYFLAYNTVGYQLIRKSGRIEKAMEYGFKAPVHFLVPMAVAAMQFLTEADLAMIRKCESPDCTLLFYDTSKNHRRRWCSMLTCGNRAKVAEYYRRNRK